MTTRQGWVGVWLTLALMCLSGGAAQAGSSTEDSIWPRIAAGMRMVDPEQPEAVTWARYYAQHPLQFGQMMARAEPFLWYIVEAVELRDMPLEIALLPAIESGFDAQARSQRGAGGLWQFVPDTGSAMGLAAAANYDARGDVVASTRAALTYLHTLHDSFDDWLLALAAYNVGRGNLRQALREADSRNFWDLALPRETREHVPRLLGVALLVKQPDRFGITLPAIANRQAGQMVTLRQPVNLAAAADAAGVARALVRQYNPGLLDLGNTTGKPFVLLPEAEAERLRSTLATTRFPARPTPGQKVVVVAPGDSLWLIARRHQVSVRALCDWNRIRPDSVLRPGRRLVIEHSAS